MPGARSGGEPAQLIDGWYSQMRTPEALGVSWVARWASGMEVWSLRLCKGYTIAVMSNDDPPAAHRVTPRVRALLLP